MRSAECGMRSCTGRSMTAATLHLTFRTPHSTFRIQTRRDVAQCGDRRLRRLPFEGTQRLATHREGVCPGRGPLRRILRPLLRRTVELGRRGPPGDPRLAGGAATTRPGQALGRAGALSVAHVLPVSEYDARPRGEPRQSGTHAEGGAGAAGAPGPLRGPGSVRRGG